MKHLHQFFLAVLVLFTALSFTRPIALKDSHKEQTYELNPPTSDLSWFVVEYFDTETKSYQQVDITIELFGSIAPKTVENFHKLANGIKALLPNYKSKDEAITVSYKKTLVEIIAEGQYVQFGNVLPDIGPFSIYGYKFDDESFQVTFDRPGRVAMANYGADTNGCQFFITTEPLPNLNNNYVAFGQVVDGLDIVIEKLQYLEKVELPSGFDYKAKIIYSGATGLHHDNLDGATKDYLKQAEEFRSGTVTDANSMKFDPMSRSMFYEEHMDLIKGSEKQVSSSSVKHVQTSQNSKLAGVHHSSNPIELLAVLVFKLLLIAVVAYSLNFAYSKYKFKILALLGSGSGSGNDYNVVGLRHE